MQLFLETITFNYAKLNIIKARSESYPDLEDE